MVWFWIILIAIAVGALLGWLYLGRNKDAAAAGVAAGGYIAVRFLVCLAVTAIFIMLILWLFKVIF